MPCKNFEIFYFQIGFIMQSLGDLGSVCHTPNHGMLQQDTNSTKQMTKIRGGQCMGMDTMWLSCNL